jgi:hypothetical protein
MTKNKQGGLAAPIKTKNMIFIIHNITMTYAPQGGYVIKGIVNGANVTAHTNDSEVYDWYNDDTEPSLHIQAVNHCEWKLEEAFINEN